MRELEGLSEWRGEPLRFAKLLVDFGVIDPVNEKDEVTLTLTEKTSFRLSPAAMTRTAYNAYAKNKARGVIPPVYIPDTQPEAVNDKCSVHVNDSPDRVNDMEKQREIVSMTSENRVNDIHRTMSQNHTETPSVRDILSKSAQNLPNSGSCPRARGDSLYIYNILSTLLKPFSKFASALAEANSVDALFGEPLKERISNVRMLDAGFGMTFLEWVQERFVAAGGRPNLLAECEEVVLAGLRAIEAGAVDKTRGKEIIRAAITALNQLDIKEQVTNLRMARQAEWSDDKEGGSLAQG